MVLSGWVQHGKDRSVLWPTKRPAMDGVGMIDVMDAQK